MPIQDTDLIAKVLFAETSRLLPDPAAPTGLTAIRGQLAWMISRSDDGVGFAPPVEPDATVYGDKALLAAWQECSALAKAPVTPAQVKNRDPDVAFFAITDPTKNAFLYRESPWLKNAALQFNAVGSALKDGSGVPVTLFLSADTNAPRKGRFPNDEPRVQEPASLLTPGFTSPLVASFFFVVILILLGFSAWIAAPAADAFAKRVDKPVAKAKADIAVAQAALEDATKRLNKARENVKPTTPATQESPELKALAGEVEAKRQVLADAYPLSLLKAWGVAALSLIALFCLISFALNSQLLGFLVDERGRMSLARLQLVVWTILILSTYWSICAWNIGINFFGGAAPGQAVFPSMSRDLWLLLGIVTASPIVSTLILDSKAVQPAPSEAAIQPAATAPPNVNNEVVTNKGLLDARTNARSWSFLDLFIGEYVGNRGAVDVSRIQQFVFTLLAVIGYAALAWGMFDAVDAKIIAELPTLNQDAVALIGLSHAAYLAAKGVQK